MTPPIVIAPHWLGAKSIDHDYLYLPLCMSCASKSNSAVSPVLYLSVNTNDPEISGVDNIRADVDRSELEMLDKNYLHLSTNHHRFEYYSILRHFYIRDFMISRNIESCFLIESDVLLFQRLSDIGIPSNEVYLTNSVCISTSHVTKDYMQLFCELILRFYTSEGLRRGMTEIYADMQERGLPGGICDMTFAQFININAYNLNVNADIRDMTRIFMLNNNIPVFFDDRLSRVDYEGHSFALSHSPTHGHPIKKIDSYEQELSFELQALCASHTQDAQESFDRVLAGSIHFQGADKSLMSNYGVEYLLSPMVNR